MTDKSDDTANTSCKKPRKRGWRAAFAMITIALAGAFAGAFATKAVSHNSHWGGKFGHHRGFMRTKGPMWFMRGPIDPERALRRSERRAKHFAIEVDATPEQTERLVEISKSLTTDVLPIRKSLREMRKNAVALLTADNVDRVAIEQLRSEQLEKFEDVTKRVTTALADAAEVLTAEQRKRVSAFIEKRGKRRGGWWRHRDEKKEGSND